VILVLEQFSYLFDNWWSIVFKNVILLFAIFISIKIYPLLQGNFINYLKYLFQIEVEEWICCLYYRTSECLGFVHVSWTGWLLAASCYATKPLLCHVIMRSQDSLILHFLSCVLKDPILASVVMMSWLPCAPLGWLSLSCRSSSSQPLLGFFFFFHGFQTWPGLRFRFQVLNGSSSFDRVTRHPD